MIIIKSENEIRLMRMAGKVTAMAMEAVRKAVRPGITTLELDEIARDVIVGCGAYPTFYQYNGYPKNICASVNDEIVHGIPDKKKVLKEGDIVSIDIGATLNGYVGDMARTFAVGEISQEKKDLIEATKGSFYAGLEFCREGNRLYDVSHAIQSYAESRGYSVVRDYVGHGIGKNMHEDPSVPNYGNPGFGVRLKAGMTLAIEPMINIGVYDTKVCADGWTVKTADGKASAHYENTIALTKGEPSILTVL